MDRNLIQAELSGGKEAGVAAYDYAFTVNNERLTPAEFLDGRSDFSDSGSWNLPGVPGKRDYFVDWPRGDAQLVHESLSTSVV
jgi:hypothetical protein